MIIHDNETLMDISIPISGHFISIRQFVCALNISKIISDGNLVGQNFQKDTFSKHLIKLSLNVLKVLNTAKYQMKCCLQKKKKFKTNDL